jgi:hypothetical protein
MDSLPAFKVGIGSLAELQAWCRRERVDESEANDILNTFGIGHSTDARTYSSSMTSSTAVYSVVLTTKDDQATILTMSESTHASAYQDDDSEPVEGLEGELIRDASNEI